VAKRKKKNRRDRPEDDVDTLIAGWEGERTDLDLGWLELVARFRNITKMLRADVTHVLPGSGCGNSEFEILMQLRAVGPPYGMRPTDIFRALHLSSGAVTGRIDRLVALGWVTREQMATDRRAFWIRLSEKGLGVTDLLVDHGAARSLLAHALQELTHREQADLRRLMSKLYKAFPGVPVDDIAD
jgi:DNA-binding MarR family transcriptional regulator